jgi:hypothetical protein
MHKQNRNSFATFLTVILALSIGSFIMVPANVQAANPPTITLLPPAAPPGTPITVNGTNFTPGATVDLSWYGYIVDVPGITGHLGYYQIQTGITVAPDGNFLSTIIAPYDISDTVHFVNATQNGVGTGIVNATFTIMPSLQLSPTPTNYTDGQEVILHIYGGPTGTIPVPPTMELESLKFTYDNNYWGYDDSHLTTEGPVATGGFTGGDIGGNITIRFTAVGGVGVHCIRAFEGPSTTSPWLSCEIGGQVVFNIVGPSPDTQAVLSGLASLNATLLSVQGNTATIRTNQGTINGTITSINNGVATVNTSLGTLNVSVDSAKNSADSAKSSADNSATYSIGALVLSIISLIILVVVAIQVFRKRK